MTQKELSTVTRLGCYRCATVDSIIKTADKHKVRLILIENGSVSINKDWNWTDKFLKPLKEHGYDIHVIDFSEGVPGAILEIGKALGRKDKAMDLAREYTRSLKRIRNDKKILILHGWGKRGVRVEAPGGYSDRFFLEPLGCVNAGGLIKKQDTKVNKGYFPLKNWQAVLKANPDIIVTYGKSYTVQKNLVQALKRHPELAKVIAIRDHAIYTLPFYMNSSITQYPKILKVWADAVYAVCRE
jgi:ABC-type Fe3+-hydroxamate transport system substrate-binding protein